MTNNSTQANDNSRKALYEAFLYEQLLKIKKAFNNPIIDYPIYGVDFFGEFKIDTPPKWVSHLESLGIEVEMGAWGIRRGEATNDK
jgi:hypothetical protein